MGRLKAWGLQGDNVPSLEHTTKTAVAALLSLVIARTLQLPEVYWAAITTLIVMQSTLAATVANAGQQMVGTALGALAGALLVQYVGSNVPVFVAGVFILGLACAALHLERTAYRFASVTLAIVVLVVHQEPAWVMAAHRFTEVTIGIAVGLAMAVVWPERPAPRAS